MESLCILAAQCRREISPAVPILLQQWRRGDRAALGQLAEIPDGEFRRLAWIKAKNRLLAFVFALR